MSMNNPRIDHADVQGLFLGFGRKWNCGRFFYCRWETRDAGLALLQHIMPLTSCIDLRTEPLPDYGVNAAFTFRGLARLELDGELLGSFPADFKRGMRYRAHLNGDNGDSAPERWDPVWTGPSVHLWIGLYARSDEIRDRWSSAFTTWVDGTEGVTVLDTQDVHRFVHDDDRPVHIQDPGSRPAEGDVLEHFGFRDGLSNPALQGWEGFRDVEGAHGGGKLSKDGEWVPLANGEFLLGHVDEDGEFPLAPHPRGAAHNGTFLVLRKLEQDVDGYRDYVRQLSARVDPDGSLGLTADDLAERMMGRRRDGTPLSDPGATDKNTFRYEGDERGHLCPLGAHSRRANPRDSMGFRTDLVNRHRILRRGITYGKQVPADSSQGDVNPDTGQGLMFLALNVDITRQFEFIQQQWINFGNDLDQGNDRDPIVGNHDAYAKMVIPGDGDRPTVICTKLKRFVRVRGGDYFFLPGITAFNEFADRDNQWRHQRV